MKVPGGWFFLVENVKLESCMEFIHDPEHRWELEEKKERKKEDDKKVDSGNPETQKEAQKE